MGAVTTEPLWTHLDPGADVFAANELLRSGTLLMCCSTLSLIRMCKRGPWARCLPFPPPPFWMYALTAAR